MKLRALLLTTASLFLAGCQSGPSIHGRLELQAGPSSEAENQAMHAFSEQVEDAWRHMLGSDAPPVTENSSIELILVPGGNYRLKLDRVESVTGAMARDKGAAIALAVQRTADRFSFPETLYSEFVRKGEIHLVFTYLASP